MSEKVYAAERAVARIRLAVVGVGTVWAVAENRLDPLMVGLVFSAVGYALAVAIFAPYRRFRLMTTAWFTAITDAAFSTLWIHATGGVESPWYVLYYLGLIAIAFRFGARETVAAAFVYAVSYAALLFARGELTADPVLLRCAFIGLEAGLCALLASETQEQERARGKLTELAKQAEGAESKLRGILQAARTPILVFDATGRVEFVNDRARSLFRADLAGATLEDVFQRFKVTSAADSGKPVARSLDGTWDRPLQVLRTGGDVREVLINVSGYADPQGLPAGMIAVCYDVTEEKKVEKRLRQQRLRAEEGERRRIARELHDEVGQVLTGIKLALDTSRRVDQQPNLEEARRLVDDLLQRVRNLSLDLRPAVLDDLGLVPALLWHIERYTSQTKIAVDFKHTGIDQRFGQDVETAAYRMVQEALTNIARHANVQEATVRAWADAEQLSVQIEDRGTGFDPNAVALGTSSGLASMRERALLLGGTLTLESLPGGGTRIAAEIPLGERRESGLTA